MAERRESLRGKTWHNAQPTSGNAENEPHTSLSGSLLVRPGFRQSGLRRRHQWATDKAAISDNIGSHAMACRVGISFRELYKPDQSGNIGKRD
jgi:hypothetical protein